MIDICEEHHISRDTYNSLVKDAERDGRLDQFPAEEWNAKRPFDEREELKEARYERECREIESQEKEVRFHGDSRFG